MAYKRGERGSTLVEILVGLTLIALVFLFESNARMWTVSTELQARKTHNALVLAQWQIREAYYLPFSVVMSLGTYNSTDQYRVGSTTFTATRTMTPNVPTAGACKVAVVVTWVGGTYRTDTVMIGEGRN